MGMKSRKVIWVAWFANNIDRRDDEWTRVQASTKQQAEDLALNWLRRHPRRFSLDWVMPLKEAQKLHGRYV